MAKLQSVTNTPAPPLRKEPQVCLVDDDISVREAMSLILTRAGFRVRTFASARAFLDAYGPDEPGCLVLDLYMPEMTGLELQAALVKMGYDVPIIFLSGFGDVPTTVRAVKGGALDFLEKPVACDTLVRSVREALAEDARRRAALAAREQIRSRYAKLSPREREVMLLATKGLTNKEIAKNLRISPRTVENHRAHVMEKMQAENIAELCGFAAICLSS